MATAGSILANVRKIAGDTNVDFLTDVVGLEWMDEAQQRFCNNVLPLDEIKDYTIEAKKPRFDLPTDCNVVRSVIWYKNRTEKLDYETPQRFEEEFEGQPNAQGNPEIYTLIRRQLVIGPSVPTSTSATALVSGTLGTTATALALTAASGTFRSKGFLQIASGSGVEIIEYTTVSGASITGATRGLHGTQAIAFSSNATVTEIDMQMRYQKIPAALTATTSSPEIPVPWQRYLEKYLLYLTYLSQGHKEKAAMAYEEFEKYETETKTLVARRAIESVRIRDRRHSAWGW